MLQLSNSHISRLQPVGQSSPFSASGRWLHCLRTCPLCRLKVAQVLLFFFGLPYREIPSPHKSDVCRLAALPFLALFLVVQGPSDVLHDPEVLVEEKSGNAVAYRLCSGTCSPRRNCSERCRVWPWWVMLSSAQGFAIL